MKNHWVEYTDEFQRSPITWWLDSLNKVEGSGAVGAPSRGRTQLGYPTFCVEIDEMVFRFASLEELDHCAAVLEPRILAQPERLNAEIEGYSNGHWLSRLPGFVKPFRFRKKAVAYLRRARADFAAA